MSKKLISNFYFLLLCFVLLFCSISESYAKADNFKKQNFIEEIPFYKYRTILKPGISGWAQVNYPYGASIDDSKYKLSYDIYYIKNFSIFLDCMIFFKTLRFTVSTFYCTLIYS